MGLQIAIFYEDNNIFVKLNREAFIKSLKKHLQNINNIDEAISKIEKEIKRKTLTK
jgi:hypothetical protein